MMKSTPVTARPARDPLSSALMVMAGLLVAGSYIVIAAYAVWGS